MFFSLCVYWYNWMWEHARVCVCVPTRFSAHACVCVCVWLVCACMWQHVNAYVLGKALTLQSCVSQHGGKHRWKGKRDVGFMLGLGWQNCAPAAWPRKWPCNLPGMWLVQWHRARWIGYWHEPGDQNRGHWLMRVLIVHCLSFSLSPSLFLSLCLWLALGRLQVLHFFPLVQ